MHIFGIIFKDFSWKKNLFLEQFTKLVVIGQYHSINNIFHNAWIMAVTYIKTVQSYPTCFTSFAKNNLIHPYKKMSKIFHYLN